MSKISGDRLFEVAAILGKTLRKLRVLDVPR